MSKTACTWIMALLALAPAAGAFAAEEKDPFAGALFEAELVMGNQQRIGLTPEQRQEIVAALQRTQSAVVPSQLELSAIGERLLDLLRAPVVDTGAALAEAAEALRLENDIKLEHVRLLIEIKNLLTPEQQARLRAIRDARP